MDKLALKSVQTWIETFGFPVALCLILIVTVIVITHLFLKQAVTIRKEHKSERDEWRKANTEDRKDLTKALHDLHLAIMTKK